MQHSLGKNKSSYYYIHKPMCFLEFCPFLLKNLQCLFKSFNTPIRFFTVSLQSISTHESHIILFPQYNSLFRRAQLKGTEAAFQRYFWEKVFWKYAVNLQNTHAEVHVNWTFCSIKLQATWALMEWKSGKLTSSCQIFSWYSKMMHL